MKSYGGLYYTGDAASLVGVTVDRFKEITRELGLTTAHGWEPKELRQVAWRLVVVGNEVERDAATTFLRRRLADTGE